MNGKASENFSGGARSMMTLLLAIVFSLALVMPAGPLNGQNDNLTGTREVPVENKESALSRVQAEHYTLSAAIEYALQHNPKVRMSAQDVELEKRVVDAVQAERMPRIDFGSGASRYRYPAPLTPPVISGPSGVGLDIPEYSRNIYEVGGSLRLPIFRGGRLYRAAVVAELKKAIAQDNYVSSKQDLVFNVTSVFYKIAELEKLYEATDGNVKQLEAHKRDAELLFKAGSVAYLDLLKTDIQLAYGIEHRLAVKNGIESAYELLKSFMGIDDMGQTVRIEYNEVASPPLPFLEESFARAFDQRPEFKAVAKKKKVYEERIKIAQGKRLPDVYIAGEYGGRAGDNLGFKENWFFGARLSIPVFDGGLINAEVNRERIELQKVLEEERLLKLTIMREVRDGYLNIIHARERTEVARKAIDSARENVRIERLKYQTGAGTNTDYLDAQTDLLRTEVDYFRAYFDEEVARASLRKAMGEKAY